MTEHTHTNHPAVKLGRWLKQRRQQAGLVARVFAGQIELSPAEYAEAEGGVVRWLGAEQAKLIGSDAGRLPADSRGDTRQQLRTNRIHTIKFKVGAADQAIDSEASREAENVNAGVGDGIAPPSAGISVPSRTLSR